MGGVGRVGGGGGSGGGGLFALRIFDKSRLYCHRNVRENSLSF